MKRLVQPEILDSLPPEDARAIGSRRDLLRINWWMRHPVMLARILQNYLPSAPAQITELGAGDGAFFLQTARRLAPDWSGVKVLLLDRQNAMPPGLPAQFSALGWSVESIAADAFDWCPAAGSGRVVIANLFLHHFQDAELRRLLGNIAAHCELFIALEPLRLPWPRAVRPLLWLIGCNDVTRHDAVVSIRAGFSGNEISSHWPTAAGWRLTESRAGFFSQVFIAQKCG